MKFRMLLLVLATAALVVLSSAPALAHDYGCTPGYWKNHTDAWVGYAPTDTLISVFGMADLDLADGTSLPAGSTLMDALNFKGGSTIAGGAQIYLRAVVAKLLNIRAGIHTGDIGEFKGYVKGNIDTLTRAELVYEAGIWDADNNAPMGCPLN